MIAQGHTLLSIRHLDDMANKPAEVHTIPCAERDRRWQGQSYVTSGIHGGPITFPIAEASNYGRLTRETHEQNAEQNVAGLIRECPWCNGKLRYLPFEAGIGAQGNCSICPGHISHGEVAGWCNKHSNRENMWICQRCAIRAFGKGSKRGRDEDNAGGNPRHSSASGS